MTFNKENIDIVKYCKMLSRKNISYTVKAVGDGFEVVADNGKGDFVKASQYSGCEGSAKHLVRVLGTENDGAYTYDDAFLVSLGSLKMKFEMGELEKITDTEAEMFLDVVMQLAGCDDVKEENGSVGDRIIETLLDFLKLKRSDVTGADGEIDHRILSAAVRTEALSIIADIEGAPTDKYASTFVFLACARDYLKGRDEARDCEEMQDVTDAIERFDYKENLSWVLDYMGVELDEVLNDECKIDFHLLSEKLLKKLHESENDSVFGKLDSDSEMAERDRFRFRDYAECFIKKYGTDEQKMLSDASLSPDEDGEGTCAADSTDEMDALIRELTALCSVSADIDAEDDAEDTDAGTGTGIGGRYEADSAMRELERSINEQLGIIANSSGEDKRDEEADEAEDEADSVEDVLAELSDLLGDGDEKESPIDEALAEFDDSSDDVEDDVEDDGDETLEISSVDVSDISGLLSALLGKSKQERDALLAEYFRKHSDKKTSEAADEEEEPDSDKESDSDKEPSGDNGDDSIADEIDALMGLGSKKSDSPKDSGDVASDIDELLGKSHGDDKPLEDESHKDDDDGDDGDIESAINKLRRLAEALGINLDDLDDDESDDSDNDEDDSDDAEEDDFNDEEDGGTEYEDTASEIDALLGGGGKSKQSRREDSDSDLADAIDTLVSGGKAPESPFEITVEDRHEDEAEDDEDDEDYRHKALEFVVPRLDFDESVDGIPDIDKFISLIRDKVKSIISDPEPNFSDEEIKFLEYAHYLLKSLGGL